MITRFVCLFFLTATSFRFASADPIPARQKQGAMHAFLLVKSEQDNVIGVGEVLQSPQGARIYSRLTLRFRDGSVDEESTVYSEGEVLCLVSDHHVQKGPSFPKPLNVTINVPASEVTWEEVKDGKVEVNRKHMELPKDLANGMIPLIMQNIPASAAETSVSYLANDPKPRIVKLLIRPEARDRFTVGGLAYFANRYVVHVDLGGLTGLIAPLVGKQPVDVRDWVLAGDVPSCARMKGPLYPGGPVWTIEQTSPVWSSTTEDVVSR